MIELISCGDSLRSGSYLLHSKFDRAVNFMQGDQLAMLVTPDIGSGPNNIVLKGYDLQNAASLTFSSNSVQINNYSITFPLSSVYSSKIVIDPLRMESLTANMANVKEYIIKYAHEKSLAFILDEGRLQHFTAAFDAALASRFNRALELIRAGNKLAGFQFIKGLGQGLTPAGDDFILGFIYSMHLRKALNMPNSIELTSLHQFAKSENPFTRSFIGSALEGKAAEAWKEFLSSIGSSEDSFLAAAEKILQSGTTSGADSLTGFIIGIELKD